MLTDNKNYSKIIDRIESSGYSLDTRNIDTSSVIFYSKPLTENQSISHNTESLYIYFLERIFPGKDSLASVVSFGLFHHLKPRMLNDAQKRIITQNLRFEISFKEEILFKNLEFMEELSFALNNLTTVLDAMNFYYDPILINFVTNQNRRRFEKTIVERTHLKRKFKLRIDINFLKKNCRVLFSARKEFDLNDVIDMTNIESITIGLKQYQNESLKLMINLIDNYINKNT